MRKGFFILVFIALGCAGYLFWQFHKFKDVELTQPAETIFLINPGESFKAVEGRLVNSNLIPSGLWFEVFARAFGSANQIRSGEYKIPASYTQQELLDLFTSGKSIEYVLTVQEGLNRYEIAQAYEKLGLGSAAEFLGATEDKVLINALLHEDLPNLEGYLFPETYRLTRFTGVRNLIKMMVQTFLNAYQEISAISKIALPRHQVVTLASIVEKETGAKEDRGKISSVFHNRLHKRMPLQTDPTILYGLLVQTGKPVLNITKADIAKKTPYNTYTFVGLPPGPISNPGKAALQAAVNPEPTEFLFFVSKNDGTTQFSKSLSDHSSAVKKFQMNPKARSGKSWRDLQKKSKKH